MTEKKQRQRVAILRVLRDSEGSVSSSRIADAIQAFGYELSPRTVRLYLKEMEAEGFVESARRGRGGGRRITSRGEGEISDALVFDRIGLLTAKVDNLAAQVTFRPNSHSGRVVLNTSVIDSRAFPQAVRQMADVFSAGYGVGTFMTTFYTGEHIGEFQIPAGHIGIGTICSVTINGVLLAAGVPTISRFGGVLELHNGKPSRFTDVIYYDGTSLDPLEIFIKGGLLDILGCVQTGCGRLGVSFREVPTCTLEQAVRTLAALSDSDLGKALLIGKPNQPVLGIPVQEGRTGIVLCGGLNPIAAIEEAGIPTQSIALSQIFDFERLMDYRKLADEAGIHLV